MKAAILTLFLATTAAAEPPLVGVFPGNHPYLALAASDAVRDALEPTAVRLALLGDFEDIDLHGAIDGIRASLTAAWDSGAVYVLNLMTLATLRPLAYPVSAADWQRWGHYYDLAQVIRAWGEACGPACYLMLVPWPEHNGGWTSYGGDPVAYREAFGKLRYVLWSQGALPYTRLVWAPASDAPERLAPYSPGRWADLVGCSAYSSLAGPFGVQQCFASMRALASGVPILLAQTGACRPGSEAFATALVGYLRQQPDALGFVYFDYDTTAGGECDWRLSPAAWRRAVRELDPRVSTP